MFGAIQRFGRTTLIKCAIALTCAALLFGIGAVGYTPEAGAAAPSGSRVYEVIISGTASGNPFQRVGYVVLSPTITRTTTNGINPVDVWLTSGNPIGSPELGAISFGTNNAYLGSRSLVDVAYVSYNSATQVIAVRPGANSGGLGVNVFNSSSGVLGSLYQIYDGEMQLQLRNGGNTIVGGLDVVAKGAYYYTAVSYRATITGRFIGTV